MTYKIPFTNRYNESCRVEILRRDSGADVTLSPATHPIITYEDDEEDVLMPVRTSHATICFIASYEVIQTFIANTVNSLEWRVLLYVGDLVRWSGFLASQSYNQDYISGDSEFSTNAIDDLTALRSFNIINPSDSSLISTHLHTYTFTKSLSLIDFRHYLTECFAHVDYYDDHMITFEQGEDNFLLPTDELLSLSVIRRLFVEPYEESDGTKAYNSSTCFDFLETFCRTFGFQLRQIGLFFVFSRCVNDPVYYDPQYLFELYSAEDLSGSNTPLSQSYDPSDVNHSISVIPATSKITVTSHVSKYDNSLSGINVKNITSIDRGRRPLSYPSAFWTIRFVGNDANQQAKLWTFDENRFIWTEVSQLPSYQTLRNMELHEEVSGAVIVSEDYYCGPESDPGSAETQLEKCNYDFHTRIYITPGTGVYHRIDSNPALVLLSPNPVFFVNGGIEIKMKVHTAGRAAPVIPFKSSAESPDPSAPIRCKLRMRLVIGDKSWNGNYWVNHKSAYFSCVCEAQHSSQFSPLSSNKTLSMDFIATGYVTPVPVDQPLYGDVRFEIIHASAYTVPDDLHVLLSLQDIVYLEDLEINYCPGLDSLWKTDDDPSEYKYMSNIGNYGDELSIDLDMHTNRDDQSSYGLLSRDNLPVGLIDGQRLENYLKNIYVAQYGQPRTYLRISVLHAYAGDEESYMVNDDKTYIPLAYSEIDWLDMSSTILFVEAL